MFFGELCAQAVCFSLGIAKLRLFQQSRRQFVLRFGLGLSIGKLGREKGVHLAQHLGSGLRVVDGRPQLGSARPRRA